MKEKIKDRLMPYRFLAGLLALVLAAGFFWYGAILVLAGRSGMRLRDLSGDRDAMQGVALTGVLQDDTWQLDFTVTEKGVQNNFVPQNGSNNSFANTPFYYSVTPVPAPGANTSEPVPITDKGGTRHYSITTDEVAFYINVWGEQGRELVLFDTGLRCHSGEGQYFFESTSRYIGDEGGHMMWFLQYPDDEDWTQANEDAYWRAQNTVYTVGRTRTERYDLVMICAEGETRVFRIDRWGSTLDLQETVNGTGYSFTDYTQPVGEVDQTAVLPGVLRRAGRTAQNTAVAMIQNEQGLAACALDTAGALTDQTLLLTAEEAGDPCVVSVVTATAKTGFADIGLLLEADGPAAETYRGDTQTTLLAAEAEENEQTFARCPWAAALRVEDGHFTAVERLPLTVAGDARSFLAAGLDETGSRLVTVQQLKPTREEQPPAGVRGPDFHLAGDVSTAVWQGGEKLYEGILEGDWKEDAWRRSFLWGSGFGMSRRCVVFGEDDPYGNDTETAFSTFYQAESEVDYR